MKRIYSLFLALSSTILLHAQNNVGIGTNSIDPSAKLEVNASDKGLLIPRVALTSTTDVATILTPATSLLVYNTNTAGTAPTNVTPGYYYWDGTKWVRMTNTVKAQNGANISTTAPNASATDPYVELGGPLVRPTTVSALTATNKMSFTGTGVDAFNVAGATFSVDASNNRVGININAPKEALDVTGTIYGSVNGIFGGSYISGTNYENQFFTPTGADNTFHSEQFSTVTTAMTGISMFQNGGSSLEQDLWTHVHA